MKRALLVLGIVALIAGGAPAATSEPASVNEQFGLQAHLELEATALECDNKGSTVEFTGVLVVGGLAVDITFRNNVKGTHELVTEGVATVVVTPTDGTLSVPKQPVLGGVGGNPHLSFAVLDSDGKPGEKHYLGRCVQGAKLKKVSTDLLLGASASAVIEALTCSNKGSKIRLSAAEIHDGLDGILYLDNNKNKKVHQATEDAEVHVSLLPAQVIPKQGSLGGPGGNPLIYLQFRGDDGPIGDEHDLGRCVQLSKGK